MKFGKTIKLFGVFSMVVTTAHASSNVRPQATNSIVEIGNAPAKSDSLQFKNFPALSREKSSEAQLLAPAPGLTFLQVTYVISSSYYTQFPSSNGWEPLSKSQTLTNGDHGGNELYVVTDELGYGNNPVATWNGAQVSSATNFRTDTICVNWANTAYQIPCLSGQTVVGFRKFWNFSGNQSGLFTYQNQSTNSPFNTMYDSMSIK